MINSNSNTGQWRRLAVLSGTLFLVAATALFAQPTVDTASQPQTAPFSAGKVFTFLFMTLGPLKIIAPFVEMTRGRDKAFKRRLAIESIIIAALAILVAATTGVKTLVGWGVSTGALLLTTGIILFLIALQPVLEQYKPKKTRAETSKTNSELAPSASSLAFSPLAFPTIVTPYGIAVLILILTLRSEHLPEIFGIMAFILVLNFLAMLFADIILKSPLIATLLGILGAVIGVLQIALGVQAVINALHILGVA